MPFADNNGVRLHWQEQGQGSPILLVMGHLYSSALWYPILPALAAEHRVIWFDNRGAGDSATTPKVTLQELAALPNSRFIELEGAGHNFLVARRDEASRAMLAFVADVDRRLAAGNQAT